MIKRILARFLRDEIKREVSRQIFERENASKCRCVEDALLRILQSANSIPSDISDTVQGSAQQLPSQKQSASAQGVPQVLPSLNISK